MRRISSHPAEQKDNAVPASHPIAPSASTLLDLPSCTDNRSATPQYIITLPDNNNNLASNFGDYPSHTKPKPRAQELQLAHRRRQRREEWSHVVIGPTGPTGSQRRAIGPCSSVDDAPAREAFGRIRMPVFLHIFMQTAASGPRWRAAAPRKLHLAHARRQTDSRWASSRRFEKFHTCS